VSAFAGEPVRISTARLREQARGRDRVPTRALAADPGPSRLAPTIVLATAAVLALAAALPGIGVFGPGSGPAAAAPVQGQLVEESGPGAPGLPQTGPGSSSGSDDGTRSSSGKPGSVSPVSTGATRCTAPCSTTQVISVTVLPGPFEITAAPGAVTVATGADGVGSARLDGVRVTDLRGSGAGWTLATRVLSVTDVRTGAALPGVSVEVAPACRRTAGPLTLEDADPSVITPGGTASLCIVPIASQGSLAGGLVSAYADLTVRGAPADARIVVRVRTSLS
jgi:hypothetical protein